LFNQKWIKILNYLWDYTKLDVKSFGLMKQKVASATSRNSYYLFTGCQDNITKAI